MISQSGYQTCWQQLTNVITNIVSSKIILNTFIVPPFFILFGNWKKLLNCLFVHIKTIYLHGFKDMLHLVKVEALR